MTKDIFNHTESLLAAVTDAETGQRGHLLNGQPEYLHPFTHGEECAQLDVAAHWFLRTRSGAGGPVATVVTEKFKRTSHDYPAT